MSKISSHHPVSERWVENAGIRMWVRCERAQFGVNRHKEVLIPMRKDTFPPTLLSQLLGPQGLPIVFLRC